MSPTSTCRRGYRRAVDGALVRVSAGLDRSVSGDLDAPNAGWLLLAVSGVLMLVALPVLQPTGHDWLVVGSVSAAMAVVMLVSRRIDWARLPRRATLFFPVAVCAGLFAISVGSPGLVAPLVGALTLCFAYVGLVQPPGTCLFLAPVAGFTFVYANEGLSRPIVIRLLIAVFVWTVLAELLARFTADQNKLNRALVSAAHTDVLTGVANRRDLEMHLAVSGSGDVLVLCDIDHFKQVNDSLGHSGGDRVLSDFGAMLRLTLRDGDYCARFGGEEFALILPRTDAAQAQALLERLHSVWATLQPDITFSAGVAPFRPGRSPEQTLTAADVALYEAKRSGRNTDRIEPVAVA